MTEEELTQMAKLKAQADKRKREIGEDSDLSIPTEVEMDIPGRRRQHALNPEPKEEPKQDIGKFSYELQLGENKIVHLKPWTGKTRKQIKNMISENYEDYDIDELQEIVIQKNVHPQGVYLSDPEQQYIMMKLKEISIGEDQDFECACVECGEDSIATGSLEDTLKYHLSKYPHEGKFAKYIDIEKQSDLEVAYSNYVNSNSYDGITSIRDYETAMHIQKDDMTPVAIQEWMDDMPIRELNEFMREYRDSAPNVHLEKVQFCATCQKQTKHIHTDLPNIFEELIK